MRAISLWQPWASLVAIGAKLYETRSWSTHYRGPLLIHAAKRLEDSETRLCFDEPFKTCLKAAGYRKVSDLPRGAVVCIVDLVAIFGTKNIAHQLSVQERAFGNYQPGRFAWQLKNLIRISKPVPMRGRQGLWTPAPEELALIPGLSLLTESEQLSFWRD